MTIPHKFCPRNYKFGLYFWAMHVWGYGIQLFSSDKTCLCLTRESCNLKLRCFFKEMRVPFKRAVWSMHFKKKWRLLPHESGVHLISHSSSSGPSHVARNWTEHRLFSETGGPYFYSLTSSPLSVITRP